MGAGCSSPLRRLGKRGKLARHDSTQIEALGGNDNQDQLTIASRLQQQQHDSQQQQQQQQQQQSSQQPSGQKLALENEITIQSEINDDHPSTASYYTDGKNHGEDSTAKTTTSGEHVGPSKLIGAGAAASKMMGLSGSYVPHDRHLLVSPALSPAPSICQSPTPANTYVGCPFSLDLNHLNEAFKTLTFGLPNNQLNYTNYNIHQATKQQSRIKQPERPQSDMHNYYSQQLVQNQDELINLISVIFITTDYSLSTYPLDSDEMITTTTGNKSAKSSSQTLVNSSIDSLTQRIESNLRIFCDEHSFNLRFLNLSYGHLSKCFHVNNLQDVAMRIFEQEFKDNGQRLIVIVLANNVGTISSGGPGGSVDISIQQNSNADVFKSQYLDKRQLPTKIEAQYMNELLGNTKSNLESKTKELLKKWYNQVGNIFCLNPIYTVYPKILSNSKDEHIEAWQQWLSESSTLIKALASLRDKDHEFASSIVLKSLFGSHIEFLTKEPVLLKRTLLIRNYSQISTSNLTSSSSGQQQQQQQVASASGQYNRDGNLNELARLLADQNKLTLKRMLNDDDFFKTVNDWVCENFNKFLENFLENRIVQGKYVPPFIENNLFIELTCQRHYLEYYLDNTTESFETKCHNFYKTQICPLLNGFINGTTTASNSDLTSSNGDSQQSLTSSQPSTNHLVLISGPKGCGKTTLFAQIIKYVAQDLLNKAQIIYRFCGVTLDSLNPNRLLRSICEQFCQTQGENITAASYIYSAFSDIMNSLNKIIKQQDSLIFLDGPDIFKKNSIELGLDWLCEIEANPRIKIFIMLETDSDLYKKALSTYTDATYISLDNPTLNEWASMLNTTARSKRLSSACSLYDEIKNLNLTDSKETNITYGDVGDILHMCHIRKLNNELVYSELTKKIIQSNSIQGLKNVHKIIFSHLHYIITPYQLCALFVAFDSSRNGISEQDILNIMTLISQKANIEQRFSSSIFSYLKIQLQPWLRYIICDKRVVKVTFHTGFLTKAIDYYVPSLFPKIIAEVREALVDYYGRSFKQRSLISWSITNSHLTLSDSSSVSADSPSKDHVSSAERIWLSTQSSEMLNLLILTSPNKARDYFMNKHQFFNHFQHGSSPEEFIEDYDRLKAISGRKLSQNEEVQSLVNYIRQSVFPLRYDGSQVYSQIYCRAYDSSKVVKFSKSKKFNEIISLASCPPIRNLLPISEMSIDSFIRMRIGSNQPSISSLPSASSLATVAQKQHQQSSAATKPPTTGQPPPPTSSQQLASQQQQSKRKIFTIKDNHRHVIIIYPDKSSLSVWDIYEEKAVRTINNIDQPRDLRMIDKKRAVILCNRELRVYDLDSGEMLTKLKGVMNQKMPFFEVFGEDYVVALARNRMYVNMLNLNTGELETTFKVGEDRFLNSLLVSANGDICVCGDETQKPFPLLVWNLKERRLLYDLRLDRHEFLTRMSAISEDGHFVVSVCRQLDDGEGQVHGSTTNSSSTSSNAPTGGSLSHKSSPNFIVIYDLNSGTLFKKWKPGLDTCGVAISLSENRSGKVMNTMVDSTILVWDLATNSKRHTLVGHSAPADVIRVQNNRLFSMDSTCHDQSLRIWDIEEGYCLAVFSPDAPVNCCQMSIRGDALICGFAAETRLSTLVMCKNETVNDVVKRNKRRKSSKSLYIFDEPPSRKSSS